MCYPLLTAGASMPRSLELFGRAGGRESIQRVRGSENKGVDLHKYKGPSYPQKPSQKVRCDGVGL